jgi:hypothetical protein
MKTLIIHAGLPKTGSSALQVFLARNHANLRRQSIDYFKLGEFDKAGAGRISAGNGFAVACSLLHPGAGSAAPEPEAHLAALKRAIAVSACQTGLLSSEYFAEADPARLRRWAAGLQESGLTLRLVYFIRAQDQLISSMYVQNVKRSHCRETPEAFAARTYRVLPHLKHAAFYRAQTGIFGAGNVTCRIYEDAIRSRHGLPLDFLRAIGADPTGFAFDAAEVNLGLSAGELAVMRELNKYRPHTRVSDLLSSNAGLAGTASPGETYALLPPAMVAEINAYFAADNVAMAKLCFGREELFPRRHANGGNIDLDEISARDLVNVLGGLLVRYDERLAELESQRRDGTYIPWKRALRRTAQALRPAHPLLSRPLPNRAEI